jgi:hypothetical protein
VTGVEVKDDRVTDALDPRIFAEPSRGEKRTAAS